MCWIDQPLPELIYRVTPYITVAVATIFLDTIYRYANRKLSQEGKKIVGGAILLAQCVLLFIVCTFLVHS